ncbi:hypothetical protein [Henriciella pelagia]|uniref:hypothetical protein n=1 Tax=Henriciella pelagia TaxID=1977912 RepID=UPI0035180150
MLGPIANHRIAVKQVEYEKRLRKSGAKRVSFWMDDEELTRIDKVLEPGESRAAFLKAAALKAIEERIDE